MIICLCNGVREAELAGAMSSGACSVSSAFSCLGCSPMCGKCVPYIRERLAESTVSSDTDKTPG